MKIFDQTIKLLDSEDYVTFFYRFQGGGIALSIII